MEKSIDIIVITFDKMNLFIKNNLIFSKYFNINFIIIDNGMQNKPLINENLKYIFIQNKNNLGYAGGINTGMKYAESDYILVVNDDVIFNKEFFEKLFHNINYYRANRYAVIGFNINRSESHILKYHYSIFSILYNFSIFPRILSLFSKKNGYSVGFSSIHFHKKSKLVKGVSGAAFMVNRDIFNNIEGFDEEFFLTYEETDFFIRLLKNGYKIYYDRELKIIHSYNLTASKRSVDYSYKSMKKFLNKHYIKTIVFLSKLWIFSFLIIKFIFTLGANKNEIKAFLSN